MVNKAYSLLVDDGACPAALESIEDVTECSGVGGDNHCHANNPLPLPPNQVRPLIIYFFSAKPLGWGKPLVKTEARHGLAQLVIQTTFDTLAALPKATATLVMVLRQDIK